MNTLNIAELQRTSNWITVREAIESKITMSEGMTFKMVDDNTCRRHIRIKGVRIANLYNRQYKLVKVVRGELDLDELQAKINAFTPVVNKLKKLDDERREARNKRNEQERDNGQVLETEEMQALLKSVGFYSRYRIKTNATSWEVPVKVETEEQLKKVLEFIATLKKEEA